MLHITHWSGLHQSSPELDTGPDRWCQYIVQLQSCKVYLGKLMGFFMHPGFRLFARVTLPAIQSHDSWPLTKGRCLCFSEFQPFVPCAGSIGFECSKLINIQVNVMIVTTCIIHVDEQISPFLDCLGLYMTYYSDSHTYKTEKHLVIFFPLSSWLQNWGILC